MTNSVHRACKCGAVYSRSERISDQPERGSFNCRCCDATLEIWDTASVPQYQMLAGPVRLSTP